MIYDLTPLTNKKQKINFRLYREAQPLNLTKEIFSKKKNYREVELKEFSILYLIINNLHVFEKRIELLSELKLYTKICVEFLNKIIDFLSSNKSLKQILLKKNLNRQNILSLINDINAFGTCKIYYRNKKE